MHIHNTVRGISVKCDVIHTDEMLKEKSKRLMGFYAHGFGSQATIKLEGSWHWVNVAHRS